MHSTLPRKSPKSKESVRIKRHGSWGRTGYYKGIYCQSTYELAFAIWAIEEGKPIQRCRLKIPYLFENRIRKYNPDFEITGKIYEIKGFEDETVEPKLIAAYEQGIEINYIGESDIGYYFEYAVEKFGLHPEKEFRHFYNDVAPKTFEVQAREAAEQLQQNYISGQKFILERILHMENKKFNPDPYFVEFIENRIKPDLQPPTNPL